MPVRVGFVGAGGIADWKHFDTLEGLDAEVVGICDVDDETRETAADRFDAAAFVDYEALYETCDLDAVFVCLPPFAHEGQEVAAARRGIDLFVEKPLALSNDYAREVLAAVEENDVVAQVGYNWRYAPGVERAREILADREVGLVEGHWWGSVPGGPDHWWRRFELSGGQVVEQGTHVFDTVRHLVGDVEWVAAAGSNRLVDAVDFADATAATMTHEDGTVSYVSTSCAVPEEPKKGLEVVAEGATIRFDQGGLSGTVDGEEIDESSDADPYVAEVEDFLAAAESGDGSEIRAPYADATRSLELTLAVNESIETGEQVHL